LNYNKTIEIEIAVSQHLDYRQNLIVPNISWGFNIHECDLLVVTKNNYLWEVEIKVSKSDLIKDSLKKHGHYDDRIRKFFFAIPERLKNHIEYIPERAGIIIVNASGRVYRERKAKTNSIANKISDNDKMKIAKLGTMRMWTLKKNIMKLKQK
jgi:hypothetical protein